MSIFKRFIYALRKKMRDACAVVYIGLIGLLLSVQGSDCFVDGH